MNTFFSGRIPSTVKSFSEFRKSKGKEWKAMVSKKKGDKEEEVQIMIGMMYFSGKEMRLKPKRGKRIALAVSNKAPYNVILEKAMDKFKAYHSDIFDTNEDYVLLLENGEEAQFIPGSCPKEFFSLKRYKEDLGKDYAKIVLYLCCMSDFLINTDNEEEDGKVPCHESSEPKRRKTERTVEYEVVDTMYESDEAMAKELQKKFDEESNKDVTLLTNFDFHCLQKTNIAHEDTASVVRAMSKNVKQDGDFFIVTRRGAPLSRIILLWQRQAIKSCPGNVLRIKYCGENGIDTGALSQEFFSSVVLDIGKLMFPDGAPVNSIYNVQNKTFKTCGEIVAASLAQGGPPPSFLAESVYQLMLTLEVNLDQLDAATHFTCKDKELFEQITNCESFDDSLRDLILDHGYTGPLDKTHQDDIIGTMQVSIVNKRLLYLREFCEGLKLFNVYALVKDNAALCKDLFVQNTSGPVDSDYVFSLISPHYSAEGTSRRKLEEAVMDNFQDFLLTVEDKNITGYTEALAWKEMNNITDEDALEAEQNQAINVSPAGVLGWLTGQKHRPVNGEQLTITANFDHNCRERNSKHIICFPQIGACSREITFPVAHMTDSTEFDHVFLLALCKGGAFSKA